ncbi:APC family permease [Leifsonia sp. L25]|uniref:APC family permease n=1 Tax=Leifsonia sp. L25 TaxID=3423957 RepID=UPI003D6901B9
MRDPAQVFAQGAPFQGIAAGMVLGILGFVGFSSADALGREAKNPYTAIPRAITWSALVVGVLYVFAAYTQIAVLGDDLAKSASPLEDIATLIGMPSWFAPILTFGVGASFFAVVVAPLNVVGRVIYVMGKEGVVPERFGRTHERHLTPHRVLLVAGPAAIVLDVILLLVGAGPMDIVVWVDTYGAYGYHGRVRAGRHRVHRLHAPGRHPEPAGVGLRRSSRSRRWRTCSSRTCGRCRRSR